MSDWQRFWLGIFRGAALLYVVLLALLVLASWLY